MFDIKKLLLFVSGLIAYKFYKIASVWSKDNFLQAHLISSRQSNLRSF